MCAVDHQSTASPPKPGRTSRPSGPPRCPRPPDQSVPRLRLWHRQVSPVLRRVHAGVLIHRPRGPNDLREPTRRPSIRGIGHCVVGDAVRPVASGAVRWVGRRGVGRGHGLLPPGSAAESPRRCPREGGRVQVEGELERLHCRAAGDREPSHAGRRRRLVGRAGRPGTRPLGLLRPAPDQYATAPALESTHRPSAVLHA